MVLLLMCSSLSGPAELQREEQYPREALASARLRISQCLHTKPLKFGFEDN